MVKHIEEDDTRFDGASTGKLRIEEPRPKKRSHRSRIAGFLALPLIGSSQIY